MNIEYSHIGMISCVFFLCIDVLFIFLPGCYIYKSISTSSSSSSSFSSHNGTCSASCQLYNPFLLRKKKRGISKETPFKSKVPLCESSINLFKCLLSNETKTTKLLTQLIGLQTHAYTGKFNK